MTKIGHIVSYWELSAPTEPRLNIPQVIVEYPAIVYKIHNLPRKEGQGPIVGLYVFSDTGLRLMRQVDFGHEKDGCWSGDY